jgi:hypothetical protein
MELASMLAGERFSDRPSTVCPIIGSILRAYNDDLDDRRRQDLYRYAADSLGTRGDFSLQLQRAQAALDWAREVREGEGDRRRRAWRGCEEDPGPDEGPDRIACYVVKSLRRRRSRRQAVAKRWSDGAHAEMVELLDRLIAIGSEDVVESLVGEFVEETAQPVATPAERATAPQPMAIPAESATAPQPVAAPPQHATPAQRTRERSAEVLGGIILVGAAVVLGRACRAVAA